MRPSRGGRRSSRSKEGFEGERSTIERIHSIARIHLFVLSTLTRLVPPYSRLEDVDDPSFAHFVPIPKVANEDVE